MKKCRSCKEPFTQRNSLQIACSPDCAYKLAKGARERKEKKQLTEFRKKDKSLNKHIAEAQAAVNAYIRIRDKGKGCISCEATTSPQWDAGHYRSRGSASHLRFNLLNNNKQCNKCNRFLGGNVVEYRKGLIKKIGEARVLQLEHENAVKHINIEYCERVKRIFKKRERLYKKINRIIDK